MMTVLRSYSLASAVGFCQATAFCFATARALSSSVTTSFPMDSHHQPNRYIAPPSHPMPDHPAIEASGKCCPYIHNLF
ncbi:hypothetical protein GDO78_011193 [Eleutherodactylus coqui]|uniref:Uncharacterized protein n=1 Tax=Eleutherodactylus coqui TaxID=57060 RepID=A0A8J6F6A4_ELECQ|nr:hypothetical protein GDO78_011193 [Eleutherodactylus coqui]